MSLVVHGFACKLWKCPSHKAQVVFNVEEFDGVVWYFKVFKIHCNNKNNLTH